MVGGSNEVFRFSEPLELSGTAPLAQGKQKLVFEFPGDPRLLVKVINPTFAETYYRQPFWFLRAHRERHYHVFVQELKEQFAMRVFNTPHLAFVSSIVGLVDTDKGVGQVVEAIRGVDGELAPTLHDLIMAKQFEPTVSEALDEFLDWYRESEVIISDLRPRNLVLSAAGKFIAVDGLGNKNTIPLRHLRWANRLKNRRKAEEVRNKIKRFARKVEMS